MVVHTCNLRRLRQKNQGRPGLHSEILSKKEKKYIELIKKEKSKYKNIGKRKNMNK
jgi:hypothetical protein